MSYYLMHRGWMDRRIFEREPFTSATAWIWLIENAAWEPTVVRIERSPVPLERGELSFSEPFLATKWKWSRSRVHRFLEDLTTWGMITRRNSPTRKSDRVANRGQSIITLCNYEKYQDVSLILEQRRGQTLNRLRTDSEQKNNTGNTDKQENKKDSESPRGDSGADAPAVDPIKELWNRGKAVLGNSKGAASVLGQLRKEHGAAAVMEAIVAVESALPSDPLSYLIGCLNRRRANGNGRLTPANERFLAGREATLRAVFAAEERDRADRAGDEEGDCG